MTFSPGQQGKYRPLVARAWQAHCLRTGQNPDVDSAHETWYRKQLMDACGIYTTKQANQTTDFDGLMAHFAAIAGDEGWTLRTAEGDERRLRYLIRREMERGGLTEQYVQGIARNMGFLPQSGVAPGAKTDAAFFDDLPADHLRRIWIALVRHNKRHAGQRVERSAWSGERKRESRVRSPRVNAPLPF
ncbi:MAG: hypothetical protein NT011_13630 [Kiritimatiellaeota bacterium]|nr:hypothetical protein [Kiritimatiellota bacterium]